MTDPISMRAIGRVVGGRSEAIDDQWDGVVARIELDPAVVEPNATDGTPVLDVKPYLSEFGPRGDIRQPAWSTELMHQY